MKQYELVREILNSCGNNQMRDVFFDEIETDDPAAYLRAQFPGPDYVFHEDRVSPQGTTIFVEHAGMTEKYLFTELT
jgi:hypothetical protein